jgi:hypothetical protein
MPEASSVLKLKALGMVPLNSPQSAAEAVYWVIGPALSRRLDAYPTAWRIDPLLDSHAPRHVDSAY